MSKKKSDLDNENLPNSLFNTLIFIFSFQWLITPLKAIIKPFVILNDTFQKVKTHTLEAITEIGKAITLPFVAMAKALENIKQTILTFPTKMRHAISTRIYHFFHPAIKKIKQACNYLADVFGKVGNWLHHLFVKSKPQAETKNTYNETSVNNFDKTDDDHFAKNSHQDILRKLKKNPPAQNFDEPYTQFPEFQGEPERSPIVKKKQQPNLLQDSDVKTYTDFPKFQDLENDDDSDDENDIYYDAESGDELTEENAKPLNKNKNDGFFANREIPTANNNSQPAVANAKTLLKK